MESTPTMMRLSESASRQWCIIKRSRQRREIADGLIGHNPLLLNGF
jgi:hypothetical protein